MQSITLAELEKNLRDYVKEVRAGREVVIRDRKRPFAKLVPIDEDAELEAHVLRLVAEGRARLPIAPLPPEFWTEERSQAPLEQLVALVSEDRDED